MAINVIKMGIIVDPRVELLIALQVVAGDSSIDLGGSRYYQDMLSWFAPFWGSLCVELAVLGGGRRYQRAICEQPLRSDVIIFP